MPMSKAGPHRIGQRPVTDIAAERDLAAEKIAANSKPPSPPKPGSVLREILRKIFG
jgi:hypothetical protein